MLATWFAHRPKLGTQLIRDVFAIDLAGKHFFRADYDQNLSGGVLHKSFICTELNGYLLNWTLATDSEKELEDIVSSLQRVSFWQAEVLPNSTAMPSTVSANDLASAKPVSEKPASEKPESQKPAASKRPLRVRVSQSVSKPFYSATPSLSIPKKLAITALSAVLL